MFKKLFIAIPLFLVLLLTDALAQQTITGRVVNENADPLSQVQILNISSQILGNSNNKGWFQITVKQLPCSLIFKKAGFETKTLWIKTADPLRVELTKSSEKITEVYVLAHQNYDKV